MARTELKRFFIGTPLLFCHAALSSLLLRSIEFNQRPTAGIFAQISDRIQLWPSENHLHLSGEFMRIKIQLLIEIDYNALLFGILTAID